MWIETVAGLVDDQARHGALRGLHLRHQHHGQVEDVLGVKSTASEHSSPSSLSPWGEEVPSENDQFSFFSVRRSESSARSRVHPFRITSHGSGIRGSHFEAMRSDQNTRFASPGFFHVRTQPLTILSARGVLDNYTAH